MRQKLKNGDGPMMPSNAARHPMLELGATPSLVRHVSTLCLAYILQCDQLVRLLKSRKTSTSADFGNDRKTISLE
jgi:hypothetical protein